MGRQTLRNHYCEARKTMKWCRLRFLQDHWEPSENEWWFTNNVFCGRKRPHKNFRLLYEWVKDTIKNTGSSLASEVRNQAEAPVGEQFGTL